MVTNINHFNEYALLFFIYCFNDNFKKIYNYACARKIQKEESYNSMLYFMSLTIDNKIRIIFLIFTHLKKECYNKKDCYVPSVLMQKIGQTIRPKFYFCIDDILSESL